MSIGPHNESANRTNNTDLLKLESKKPLQSLAKINDQIVAQVFLQKNLRE